MNDFNEYVKECGRLVNEWFNETKDLVIKAIDTLESKGESIYDSKFDPEQDPHLKLIFYNEILRHIKPECCKEKWFSIGDFHEIYQDHLYCPFCGKRYKVKI